MNIRGWVYVISNVSMPGLLKVGFSTKDPDLRARELSHTGSPQPYVVEYDALVTAPRESEQRIHKLLRDKRDGKEWFRCSLGEAITAIHAIAKTAPIAENYRDRSAVEAARVPGASSGKPTAMPSGSGNRSGRWTWSERTLKLMEKVGPRSFGPGQYKYAGEGQVMGFEIRDTETLWVAIEDVEIVE